MSTSDEPWRASLREVGLTRLAEAPNRPKRLPRVEHPVYHNDEYRSRYGQERYLYGQPRGSDADNFINSRARSLFYGEIQEIMLIFDENKALPENVFDRLVRMGQNLRDSAQETYYFGYLVEYMFLVDRFIVRLDNRSPSAWTGNRDREVLVALSLKAQEIELRWPMVGDFELKGPFHLAPKD